MSLEPNFIDNEDLKCCGNCLGVACLGDSDDKMLCDSWTYDGLKKENR